MSIILQNRNTGLFVAEGDWNADQAKAITFPTGLDAYDHCITTQLRDMDIILTFGSPTYDTRVAVPVRAVGRC